MRDDEIPPPPCLNEICPADVRCEMRDSFYSFGSANEILVRWRCEMRDVGYICAAGEKNWVITPKIAAPKAPQAKNWGSYPPKISEIEIQLHCKNKIPNGIKTKWNIFSI